MGRERGRRLTLAEQVAQYQTGVTRRGTEGTASVDTKEQGGNRLLQGLSSIASRLITPLVDVPNLPGGKVGDIAEEGLESLSSPLGIVSAAAVPLTGGASLGLTGLAGGVARVGTRLAVEAAVGGAAGQAARTVSENLPEGTPGIVKALAPLASGALVAGGASGALRGTRGGGLSRAQQRTVDAVTDPKTITDPVKKLAFFTRTAKQIRTDVDKLRSQELGIRIGRSERAIARGFGRNETGESIIKAAVAPLKGQLPSPRFATPTTEAFTTADRVSLMKILEDSKLDWEDNVAAIRGLLKVYGAGVVPQPAELRILQKVYGDELVKAIQSQRTAPEIIKQALLETINLPRAIMASVDMSAPLRQGIVLAPRFPKQFGGAIKPMVQAWFDDDFAKRTLMEIDSRAAAIGAKKAGLDLTDINALVLEGREEPFIGAINGIGKSELGGLIKASERAYVVFLNKLRLDTYENITKNWENTLSFKDSRRAAKFINNATGRAKLPGVLGKAQPLLNATFFAPQLVWSRPAVGGDLISAMRNPSLRVPVASAVGAFVGTGIGMLWLAKQAGADVEIDPRSSDFGKIRVGSKRYDFWAGYQPIARYFAQAVTGEAKTSAGNFVGIDRSDTILKFLRSKLAPVPGLVVDVATGESFLGEQLRADANTFDDQIAGRLIPLFIQDVVESMREENSVMAGVAVAPAFFGVGFSNFSTVRDQQNTVAQELFEKDYREANGAEQQIINQDPRVVDKQAEFDLRGSDYGTEIDRLETLRHQSESIMAANLAVGKLGPKDFADALGDIQSNIALRKDEARRNFQIPDIPDGSPLQAGLTGFYDLYRQADRGYEAGVETGIIDWELYDQLEHDYMQSLTPEQRGFVEQRKVTQHDPSVEWFYKQREIINKSGYYDQNDVVFEKFKNRLPVDVESFSELVQMKNLATVNGDSRTAARLNKFITAIQRAAGKNKERIRTKNPETDIALLLTGRVSKPLTRQARESLEENGFDLQTLDNDD